MHLASPACMLPDQPVFRPLFSDRPCSSTCFTLCNICYHRSCNRIIDKSGSCYGCHVTCGVLEGRSIEMSYLCCSSAVHCIVCYIDQSDQRGTWNIIWKLSCICVHLQSKQLGQLITGASACHVTWSVYPSPLETGGKKVGRRKILLGTPHENGTHRRLRIKWGIKVEGILYVFEDIFSLRVRHRGLRVQLLLLHAFPCLLTKCSNAIF